MKIGILTFQNTLNYGAMYQEYALQKYINNKDNASAQVIDYINDNIERNEAPLKLKEQRSIKGVLKYFLLHRYQVRKRDKFNQFTEKYINKSEKKYNKDNIKEINDIYDKIIVGSDQVWNTLMTGSDYTYYLDFLDKDEKKSSYAASFGYSEVPEENREDISKLLAKFKDLNVREQAGKEIIKKLVARDSNVVVDPTFLLDKNEWEQMSEDNISIKEPYIVAYMVNAQKETFEFIDDLAKKENLKIIYVSDFIKKHNKGNVQIIHDASPAEFISLIKNAQYVVTGSFHAICMSIILEKNFIYMYNNNKVNSRIENIINMAGIKDRQLNSGEYIPREDIDYLKVKEKMKANIENSKEILNKIIEE